MSRIQANAILLAAALLWGSGNVVQQTILQHMGPITANGLRCLIAIVVVLPFCWREEKNKSPIDKKAVFLGFLSVLSFTAATATLQIAYGLTSVSNAGFLANTSTILTPFLAWAILRELPRIVIIPAAILAFAGICMLGGGWPSNFAWGDSLCFIAAAFFAMWMILQGRFVIRHGRASSLTFAQFLGCGSACLVFGLATEVTPSLSSPTALLQLTYLGLVATGGGYFLLAVGQRYTSASEVAIISSVEAVFGACFAHLFLGDQHSLAQMAGATLIISAIVLIEVPTKKIQLRLKRWTIKIQNFNTPDESEWQVSKLDNL